MAVSVVKLRFKCWANLPGRLPCCAASADGDDEIASPQARGSKSRWRLGSSAALTPKMPCGPGLGDDAAIPPGPAAAKADPRRRREVFPGR